MTENIVCYGLVDSEGVLINAVLVDETDFETLERIKEQWNAVNYHLINQDLYIVKVNEMYWNGIHWDSIVNKP